MNRKSNHKGIEDIVTKIRKEIPEVIIRTTLIVGFPGETDKDYNELYKFVEEAKLDKLGVFMYSKEDGTPAARLKEQIHHMTKKKRHSKIMMLQKEISKENLENKIGKTYTVMLESVSFDKKYYIRKNIHGCTRRRWSSICKKRKRT